MGLKNLLRPLFVARANSGLTETRPQDEAAPPPPGTPPEPEPAPAPASPVFLTVQSLISFPGAALGINILWHLVALLKPELTKQPAVPLIAAFLIGAVIYLVSINATMSAKDKAIGFVIAFINAAWLGLNALGINVVKPPGS